MRDCNINSIKNTIDVILKHLFDTYGKITPQIITQREDVVKQINFDVDAPIDTVLNGVEELGDIATADLNPYINQQYINLDYNIINKTGRYKIGLWEWNCKDTTGKNLGCIQTTFLHFPSGIEGCF